jgi:Raf kinase inhibitor-like YbhB/YbcL family protein
MMRALLPALLGIALASCGARDRSANANEGGRAVDNATLARLELTSPGFQNGEAIPAEYTCDGADRQPPLSWGEPPAGTKSFALVVDDPDAPSGLFRHWGAYDIPAGAHSIPASGFAEATNDFGKPGYGGPCPPPGHGPHHYHFKLFALDVDKLGLAAGVKIEQLESEAQKHAIGRGELVGTYERK